MRKVLLIIVLLLVLVLLLSCRSVETVVTERVKRDTVFQRQTEYDSVYIDRWHSVTQQSDTVLITDTQVEYRYRHLHDSVYINKVDSIPYKVEIEKIKTIRAPPWYMKVLAWIGAIAIIIIAIWLIVKTIRSRLFV